MQAYSTGTSVRKWHEVDLCMGLSRVHGSQSLFALDCRSKPQRFNLDRWLSYGVSPTNCWIRKLIVVRISLRRVVVMVFSSQTCYNKMQTMWRKVWWDMNSERGNKVNRYSITMADDVKHESCRSSTMIRIVRRQRDAVEIEWCDIDNVKKFKSWGIKVTKCSVIAKVIRYIVAEADQDKIYLFVNYRVAGWCKVLSHVPIW